MSVIRLDRKLKYQGTILKIYEDTVMANGHEAHWDFIHHDGAAAVVPVMDDGKILMVRQYRNALDRYTLEIPAGRTGRAYAGVRLQGTGRRDRLPFRKYRISDHGEHDGGVLR